MTTKQFKLRKDAPSNSPTVNLMVALNDNFGTEGIANWGIEFDHIIDVGNLVFQHLVTPQGKQLIAQLLNVVDGDRAPVHYVVDERGLLDRVDYTHESDAAECDSGASTLSRFPIHCPSNGDNNNE
jgi:hypothetical protein